MKLPNSSKLLDFSENVFEDDKLTALELYELKTRCEDIWDLIIQSYYFGLMRGRKSEIH